MIAYGGRFSWNPGTASCEKGRQSGENGARARFLWRIGDQPSSPAGGLARLSAFPAVPGWLGFSCILQLSLIQMASLERHRCPIPTFRRHFSPRAGQRGRTTGCEVCDGVSVCSLKEQQHKVITLCEQHKMHDHSFPYFNVSFGEKTLSCICLLLSGLSLSLEITYMIVTKFWRSYYTATAFANYAFPVAFLPGLRWGTYTGIGGQAGRLPRGFYNQEGAFKYLISFRLLIESIFDLSKHRNFV